ncbi:type VI secretion system lipoprotein TssJ [Erwinia piriflorinigrans]|uniref:Putative type VI protein secretion system (Intracellular trafficking, secretion, and vesicular transport) n=1 Tax=Erwinia piriflorinigrans CFBP 5888 TaxID=1161919 RepID=V5ZBP5_9GAMM|nr:type VI secretion system lipoprotein TssJ [Erwinia piriflorinigrans]CCG88442.1 putative type VI protein secretion system (Intracellular trafficking, secretion, and vesicular transport) [Erwinia piriflorinigrans CFBP 5888]
MHKTSISRLIIQAFLLAASILLAGCVSSSHSVPARYSLVFQAHPQINDSAPLKVRVLLLKSDADFMAADFYSLQTHPQGVLGQNLLNSEQFFLMPGQTDKKLLGQTSPEARYIGIMAEYQALDGKKWRISLPVPLPTERHFYQFWQGDADNLRADIIADINGVRVINPRD